MKKTFLLFIITILLAGCAGNMNQNKLDERTAPLDVNKKNDEAEAMMRINELKNGTTPQIGKTEESKPLINQQGNNQTANNKLNNNTKTMELENLAAVYKQAVMKTNYGDIKFVFYADESPVTVNNFLKLAKEGFYNGTLFHRVIKNFMIQGGDPNSRDENWATHGMGGPGYKFQDEFNDHKLVRGSLAMANSGPNTNGSQFFIVTAEATPWLDGRHTNFGYVVEGMEIIDQIEGVEKNEKDHPLKDIKIEEIELLK